MALLLIFVLIGCALFEGVKTSCFCKGVCDQLKPSCRYGEEIQGVVKESSICYEYCEDSFPVPMQIAACFKGCLSDHCSTTTIQKWSKSIQGFFSFQRPTIKKTTESVFIVDSNRNSVVYALYVNGAPVYSKSIKTKPQDNRMISYTFMSWTVFDRRVDMIMTTLALLCFIISIILLITPCSEDEEEQDAESGKKGVEKQPEDVAIVFEEDLKKGLLEDY